MVIEYIDSIIYYMLEPENILVWAPIVLLILVGWSFWGKHELINKTTTLFKGFKIKEK